MGNSPSHSVSLDDAAQARGQPQQRQEEVYNPFDAEDAQHNFPLFADAVRRASSSGGPGSGPSIDTLAAMYPIDFPLRCGWPHPHTRTRTRTHPPAPTHPTPSCPFRAP
jgi:hypothetical protein